MNSFFTVNPTTEEIIREYKEFSLAYIDELIFLADKTFHSWRETTFAHRAELMRKAAAILIERKEELARLMAIEMGKPIMQGIAEAEKCAWVCDYYADNAEIFLTDEHIPTQMRKSYAAFIPLGVVFAIMPWNFPFWQVFRFAAPALMAGNTTILKHARNTMGCALEIERIFRKAGFPDGAFTTLVIGSDSVPKVIGHPLVKAVTLTGSTPVGSKVAEKSGNKIKKCVLELGGSDPYVILADANLEKAVETCVIARLINSGQSCIAAKRFIVVREIYNEFVQLFTEGMKSVRMGDPLDKENLVGPQARKDLQETLHQQVLQSRQKGAKLIIGGEIPKGKGFFYPPTVLSDVYKGMAAYDEETFGPVAAIIPAANEKQAIEIANDNIYGLGAAIFTEDLEKGEWIARNKLDAGCCFVNDYVKSDPRLPFGGIKQSGYGRELSIYGIKEFVNIKTVVVK